MMRAILAAALTVASVAGVSAQDRANFEGTWQIDTATSRYYGGAPTETITVDGSRMTISRTVAGSTLSTTMRMVQALIEANKTVDLLIMPGQPHGPSGAFGRYYREDVRRFMATHLFRGD